MSIDDQSLLARLRTAILGLDLAPGQTVSERGLEPMFGASRTPIRAALQRLETEGLVRRTGNAWSVAPLDLDDIRELYEFREVLETAAARLAATRASRADREALARLVRTDADETPEHSIDAGTSFHLELARLSGNRELFSTMDAVLTRLYRTRWLEVQTAESRERAHREHAALAEALLAGDASGAELAMSDHVKGTGARLVASLEASRQALRARGIRMEG